VALSVNGQEILATTPQQYAPDIQAVIDQTNNRVAPPQGWARLEASRTVTTVSHLRVWRDVYYIDEDERGDIQRATARHFPSRVVTLQADEFFVLGDNSFRSLDGRFWTSGVDLPGEKLYAPPGIVPRRFMLGKAFFVYWPAGFSAFGTVPLIPNFGEMRAIR
jgi:signal peptidase I